jgi:hypothetical protein
VKLILQIAAGTVLAWLAITGIKLLAARAALQAFSDAAPVHTAPAPAPAHSYTPAASPPPDLPTLPPSPPPPPSSSPSETNHAADSRQWSITTTDGKHYSGTGPAPPNGLQQPQQPQQPQR